MSISLKDQKMLWGRAAGRCSMPDCRINLYTGETNDPALVGENCHIIAESDDGPRADPTMPTEERNTYANLILLCRNHHKIIDSQKEKYTVERLHQMKQDHEDWVKQNLDFDMTKQRDEEQYASIIDTWEQLAHVNDWHIWSSRVLSYGQPAIGKDVDQDLYELRRWLLNRVWPKRYPELVAAFGNFRQVLQDFQNCFHEHSEDSGSNTLITVKFYHINEWNEERYYRLLSKYEFHVDLVMDLMLELSRSANLICDRIREYIMPSYRLNEGWIIIHTGPTMDLIWHDVVVQYSEEDRVRLLPYPGLKAFLTERTERDFGFGEGETPTNKSS